MTDDSKSPNKPNLDLSRSDAELISMKEFCRLVQMSLSSVNRLRRAGNPPPIVRPNPKGREISHPGMDRFPPAGGLLSSI